LIFLLSNTGYKRTTKGFDSKNYVDSRTYMYICPTYAFAPIESVSIRMFRHLLEVLRCTTNVFFATYRTIQAPSEQFWSYTGLYLKKYAQVRALHMWGSQSIIKKKNSYKSPVWKYILECDSVIAINKENLHTDTLD
jgi:tRNA U38,U39,U40 pseudouridine synthase TruA